MDLPELPFDTPVILHSLHVRANLQNPFGSKKARCQHDNKDSFEELLLRRVGEEKVALQAARNLRFLRVQTNGDCVFDANSAGVAESFTMETDASCRLFFVSCFTGLALQATDQGVVRCANTNRRLWEAWHLMEPRNISAGGPSGPMSTTRVPKFHRQQISSDQRFHFMLEMAKSGRSADEIETLVSRLFKPATAPAVATATATTSSVSADDTDTSAYAVLVEKP